MNNICDTVIFFDGTCEPDPGGVAVFGWVAYWKGERRRQGAGVIGSGPGHSSYTAAYQGLISASRYLQYHDFFGPVEFRGNNRLVINQMLGTLKVKRANIARMNYEARRVIAKFQDAFYIWIPKDQNTEAEQMTQLIYDQYLKAKIDQEARNVGRLGL